VPVSAEASADKVAGICVSRNPFGPKTFKVADSPLMVPEIVAVVRYGQKAALELLAVIVPDKIAVLEPLFGPWVKDPLMGVVVPPVSVDESVPVKLPFKGGTRMADQLPVEAYGAVHAPESVENTPVPAELLEGALPVRFRSWPDSPMLRVMF
jgi:hypothetical protein